MSIIVAPSKLHSVGFEFSNLLDISDMYYRYVSHSLSLSYNKTLRPKFYIPTDDVTNGYAGHIEALVIFLRNSPLGRGLKLNMQLQVATRGVL